MTLFDVSHLRFSRLWFWLGMLMVCVIVLLSVVRLPEQVNAIVLHDKLLHCAVYACLMGWFAQIFRHPYVRAFIAVAFMIMGIGVEYIQGMVPSRQFEILDMVANTCGVLLAWALAFTRFGNILVNVERLLFDRNAVA